MNLFDLDAPACPCAVLRMDLPPRSLTPNENIHWRIKSEPTKQYRALAAAETRALLSRSPISGKRFRLSFTFCTKNTRGRCQHKRRPPKEGKKLRPCRRCPYGPTDVTNALAAFKAGQDGICDALGVLDSKRFIAMGSAEIDSSCGPWVEVKIEVIG